MSGDEKTTVDREKVWKAVEADSSFQESTPPGRPCEISQELVYAIVDGLHTLMAERVSLTSLFKAKMVVGRLFIEGGWCEKLLSSFPPEMLPGGLSESIEFMQKSMQSLLPRLEEVTSDVSGLLASLGMSEEKALAHPRFGGFSESTMVLYRQGELTIGRLLELQPMAIIKNT